MKFPLIILFLLLGVFHLQAKDESTPLTRVGRVPWDGIYPARTFLSGGLLETALQGNLPGSNVWNDTLYFNYTGSKPADIHLTTLAGMPFKTGNGYLIAGGQPGLFRDETGVITAPYYLLLGNFKSKSTSAGSYLEMRSTFAHGTYFTRMPLPNETKPDQWMPLMLPFDSSGASENPHTDGRAFWQPIKPNDAKTNPTVLELTLHFAGSGQIWLRDLGVNQAAVPFWNFAPPTRASVSEAMTEGQVLAVGPDELNIPASSRGGSAPIWPAFGFLPDAVNRALLKAKVTATHYAVIGEVRYQDAQGCSLEMYTVFSPKNPNDPPLCFETATLEDNGPLARLEGTSDWRPFWLPFDSSQIKGRLTLLFVDSRLGNVKSISLRHLKLVQYPDNVFPVALAPSGQIPEPKAMSTEFALAVSGQALPSEGSAGAPVKKINIYWESFLLGVATTGLLFFVIGGVVFLFRRLRLRNNERELRRIASLDG